MKHLLDKRKTKFRLLNKKNDSSKIQHAEFVTLIYIRNTNIVLDKDMKEVLLILKELQKLNRKSRLIFKTNCSLSKHILWESLISEINDNLNYIKLQLDYIKENTIKINHFNYSLFWQQNKIFLDTIKDGYQKLEQLGTQILPKEERLIWNSNVNSIQDELFYMMISLLDICKIGLDFIKMSTPDNLKAIMQSVIENIPKINIKAHRYERAYITALKKYKEEFSEKRSFWDILVKVLTIDAKKSPTEHVMLGRWIDGKDKNAINNF